MRKSLMILVAMAVLLVAPASSAYADDDVSMPDSVRLGKSHGLTASESRERYGWTTEFNKAANQISSQYPDLYADARITGDATGAYLLFTTEVPAEARELIKNLPVPVELRTGAKFNEKYLLDQLMTSYDQMWKTPGTLNVTGEMNVERSGLEFYVTPNKDVSNTDLFLTAARTYAKLLVPATIELRTAYRPAEPEIGIRGGGNLNTSSSAPDPNAPYCTAGFTVRTDDAVHGMSTAGHCAEQNGYLVIYNQGVGGANNASRLARQAISPHNLDLSWYAYPNPSATLEHAFYVGYDGGSYRQVTGEANPSVGTPVANFGRTNGYHSDAHVTGKDMCSGETPCLRLSTTDRDFTAGGDSGGPWFWDNTAYGIHFGKISNTAGDLRSSFTPVFLLGYMGVRVWT